MRILIIVLGCFSLAASAVMDTPDVLDAGLFSAEKIGEQISVNWKPLTFKRISKHTIYSVVDDNGSNVIKAQADQSASGLVREINIDLREYPIMEWRWKIANLITKGDPRHKDGDDYPARIYLTFAQDQNKLSFADKIAHKFSGQYIPHSGLNYIWDNKTSVGSIVHNAYTDRLRMITIESGGEKLNQWQNVTRNVLEDYRKAFGHEPPLIVGIAIMTDADNTEESATAWYGDIRFKKLPR